MVDLEILDAHGCSPEKLKDIFKLDGSNKFELSTTSPDLGTKLDRLRKLIRSRIDEGRNGNVSNYRIFQALDTAWDTPLKQITPTMIQSLMDSNMSSEAMADALTSWGVDPSDILTEWVDPKTKKTLKKVNMPAFFRIFVPLVRSYVTIRRSKMMNDRKLVPFMKFEPAISNEATRMRCEVITSRVEDIAQQYGFWDVEDQACLRMLHYGICLRFPVEEWDREEQLVENNSQYIGEKEGEYKRTCMKEGLRYHMPHPTRMFYDQAWPTHSFNSNSGASYAGYWRIMRYGDILTKKKFYNLGIVAVGGSNEWFTSNKAFFDNVYPCRLAFPAPETGGDGAGQYDTEKKIANGFYTTADEEKGVVITELFMKIIPEEFGLGTYKYPVWFRFVIAALDTIIYATPLPYSSPVLFDGYDPVSGRTLCPSMSLEILPFQDHFGNLLSQYLLSTKQNLANMVLVDTDSVNEEDIGYLKKCGQLIWSGINFVRMSGRKLMKAQQNPQVLFPQRFPQVNTAEIAAAMKTLLEILERVLVMSSQELGQAASHEQTREEVKNIASNTSTRAEFTASSLDRSKYAWKRQIYEGLMAYGSEDAYAQIPSPDPMMDEKGLADKLSKLGFTFEDIDKKGKKLKVQFNKSAIKYETFAANRDGDDRINDRDLAAQMGAFMQQLSANPLLLTALGPDQFVAMANVIARAAGFPRDLILHNRGPDVTPEENNQQILQQVQQFIQEAMASMQKDVQGSLEQIIKENDQQSNDIHAVMSQVAELAKATGMAVHPPNQDLPPQEDLPAEAAMTPAGAGL